MISLQTLKSTPKQDLSYISMRPQQLGEFILNPTASYLDRLDAILMIGKRKGWIRQADFDQHLKKPLIQLIEQYWFQDTVMSVLGVWFDADVRKVFDALRLSTTTSPSILHQINVEFEFQAIMAEILGEGPEAL